MPFDVQKIRADFPILKQTVHGKPLVYFDNAATSQKPQVVIDALNSYYTTTNSNIHRGVHFLSSKATKLYEDSRSEIKRFINAADEKEIIFVRGTTEAINLVAYSYGRKFIRHGDEVIISEMEHHSNIVPWQILCEETGAVLKVIPINDKGELIMEAYQKLLSPKTKLVSVAHVSNALGSVNPVKQIIDMAHAVGAKVLIDGAQAIAHTTVDVRALGCDFYAFSGHKMYGPTGVGVLYGKRDLLEAMPPFQGGGDMIKSVSLTKTTYNDLPYKFEAGTPNIADNIALGDAIRYMESVGIENAARHEHELLVYATSAISEVRGIRLIGTAAKKTGVLSFIMDGVHAHDVGTILDQEGVAIRTGHHCAQPVMECFKIEATSRASFAMYNTKEEVDTFIRALYKVSEVFK